MTISFQTTHFININEIKIHLINVKIVKKSIANKKITNFSQRAKLITINSPKNNLVLCPNHHWEFDNGILQLNDIPPRKNGTPE